MKLKYDLREYDKRPAVVSDWPFNGHGGCKGKSSWGAKCGIPMIHTGLPHRFCLKIKPHPEKYCSADCFVEEK